MVPHLVTPFWKIEVFSLDSTKPKSEMDSYAPSPWLSGLIPPASSLTLPKCPIPMDKPHTHDLTMFEAVPNMEADAFAADSNMSTDTAPPYPWSGTLAEVHQPGQLKSGFLKRSTPLLTMLLLVRDCLFVRVILLVSQLAFISEGRSPIRHLGTRPIAVSSAKGYLKEFRVEQCTQFLQHKCSQHKPFTCFNWHFMNQRRRRPIRRRDGTFNYNPDVYCTSYDETSGICQNGDECQYLHRTAGDTEKRYHLRYYKTGICVHETDSRGFCGKNGPHCAFAHGVNDQRAPVYDIREQQAMEGSLEEGPNGTAAGPNNLDKERNAINEDPKWQDTKYVVEFYKTEPCKRPPRLCRQGYACPQYHNNRDRRRSQKKIKYSKGMSGGDPANCENGDNCPYCHTRTEQQFHPEVGVLLSACLFPALSCVWRQIYKSTKCNDMQQNMYCPRGAFCAFAHVDQWDDNCGGCAEELNSMRALGPDNSTDLMAILSNVLPSTPTQQLSPNSSGKEGTNKKGGEDQPAADPQRDSNFPGPISRPRSHSSSTNHSGDSLPHYPKAPGSEREDKEASIQRQLQLIDNDRSLDTIEKARCKESVYNHGYNMMSPLANMFYPASDTVESVVGNALDDLSIDLNVEASLERDLEVESQVNHTTGGWSIQTPGRDPLLGLCQVILSGPPPHSTWSSMMAGAPPSPQHHPSILKCSSCHLAPTNILWTRSVPPSCSYLLSSNLDPVIFQNSYYGSPGSFQNVKYGQFPIASNSLYDMISQSPSESRLFNSEYQRLLEEVNSSRSKSAILEQRLSQVYEMWDKERKEFLREQRLVEQQRDEAVSKFNALTNELYQKSNAPYLRRLSELDNLSLFQLGQLQEQLREDLEKVAQRRETFSKILSSTDPVDRPQRYGGAVSVLMLVGSKGFHVRNGLKLQAKSDFTKVCLDHCAMINESYTPFHEISLRSMNL
ncbi:UNK [Cordylochernes scorpioides]|uniref:UNK n=1 Tax=Cordylochernes scorpioides TaxID=51811 RepID=A0ABY6KVV8_9ARAC|nr:UNK [Cordylochernes scorpioides]